MAEASAKTEKQEKPKWLLAKEGIQLVINNKGREAEELFTRYPESLQMHAGYTFATFMDALMTFEDDKLSLAHANLKETERRCTGESGWFKTMKAKVFGSENNVSFTEEIETQIILADALICMAMLSFLQNEISGFFKGGWVLRKSWKLYQNIYGEVLKLYKHKIGDLDLTGDIRNNSERGQMTASSTLNDDKEPSPSASSLPECPVYNGSYDSIDDNTVKRLMAAVSFGYGLFQLGVSLLPPSVLKFTNLLGFSANRQNGLNCLMYARLGVDMRAPLATLTLLWYHTIVRPFYALDGLNVQAGVEIANQLIQESMQEYSESALFLFFKGRVFRLSSNIPAALSSFQTSVDNANQREIRLLSLHEVGWCHLIQLDYCNAVIAFTNLKLWSRWSRSFYAYVSSICSGACGNPKECPVVKEMLQSYQQSAKTSQLELFLYRRYKLCPTNGEDFVKVKRSFWNLLVYELLYLWNTLPSCSYDNIKNILRECGSVTNASMEPMVGLSRLIEGNCNLLLGRNASAIDSFRQCLHMRDKQSFNAPDAHVSAFSQFELATLLIKSPETRNEGKVLLQQMSNYKNYDFEQRLNVRVHTLLKRL